MTDFSLTILPEEPGDAIAIDRLHERTFGPGRFARTSYRIREKMAHRVELSFTARIGTLLVGSVRQTKIRIGNTPALLLGPLTLSNAPGTSSAMSNRSGSTGPGMVTCPLGMRAKPQRP